MSSKRMRRYLRRKSFAKSLRFFSLIIAPESMVREDIALTQSPLVLSTVNYIQAEVIDPKARWIAPPKMEFFGSIKKVLVRTKETIEFLHCSD